MQESQETQFWSLGLEDPLEVGMATHPSILPWSWQSTVHRVTKSQTQLKQLSTHTRILNNIRISSKSLQSCPTLCDPMDCSLPGFSIHGILQARTLEWVAISFSRASSRPRDRTRVSLIGGRRFNLWATREAPDKIPTTFGYLLKVASSLLTNQLPRVSSILSDLFH